MELIDTNHGLLHTLYTIAVFFGVKLALDGWRLWRTHRRHDAESLRDLVESVKQCTEAIDCLQEQLAKQSQLIAQVPKMQQDLNRAFLAMRILHGEKRWSEIRDMLMQS